MPTTSSIKIGDKFTRLEVIAFHGRNKHKQPLWECRCKCGNIVILPGYCLTSHNNESCGCLKKERAGLATRTHGGYKSPEYRIWAQMKARCSNSKTPGFEDYGGRGIAVCAGLQTFEGFRRILGARPSGEHSLDRKENNGSYSCGECAECLTNKWPLNVRWVVIAIQNRNTRRNVWLTHNGETLCAADWADKLGLPRQTLEGRLEAGWSVERALTTPSRRYRNHIPKTQM